jgi:hypothetical protein
MARMVFAFTTDSRQFMRLDVADPPLRFVLPLDNVTLKASLFLYGDTAFNVEVVSPRDTEDPGRVADLLIHTMSGLYDSIGLSAGQAFAVRLEGYFLAGTKKSAQISYSLPKFDTDIQAAGLQVHDWVTLAVSSPQLRAALRDIRLAMQTPGEVAVHCYRSIERIRQFFSVGGVDRKNTWALLASAINVERSWLDSYTAHATAVRHGELIELELVERDKCLAQAATVVIRFAAFLKGGNKNLTAPNFPDLILGAKPSIEVGRHKIGG